MTIANKYKNNGPVSTRYDLTDVTSVLPGTAGGSIPFQLTKSGSLCTDEESWGITLAPALTGSMLVCSQPGAVREVKGRLDSTFVTQNLFIQVWDSAAAIASGTQVTAANGHLGTPAKLVHTSGTDTSFSIDFHEGGVMFRNGLYVAASVTEFGYTPVTGSACTFGTQYVTVL